MSVDEDLVTACVPEAAPFLLVAEQSVREAGEGPELGLVTLSANVDDDSLTARLRAVMSPSSVLLATDRRHLQRRRLCPPCLLFNTASSSPSSEYYRHAIQFTNPQIMQVGVVFYYRTYTH